MQTVARIYRLLHAYVRVRTHIIRIHNFADAYDSALLQSYLQIRTDYVLQENWPMHDGVDIDEYDHREDTEYILATEKGKVVAGMRITAVDDICDSLSYSMWGGSQRKEDFVKNVEKYLASGDLKHDEQVWDVTRLVTEAYIIRTQNTKARAASRIGLFKILARAATSSRDHEPVWLFTTTKKMLDFMTRNNFHPVVIHHGVISESDEGESYFCILRPKSIIDDLRTAKPHLYAIARHEHRSHTKRKNSVEHRKN